jgi:hypothetical protein
MIFVVTRGSLVIWESLPLIAFVQFPWRLVGRAVLPLSLLAAAFVAALTGDRPSIARGTGLRLRLPWLVLVIGVVVLILTALPFTYPPTGYCPTKLQPDIRDCLP